MSAFSGKFRGTEGKVKQGLDALQMKEFRRSLRRCGSHSPSLAVVELNIFSDKREKKINRKRSQEQIS